MKKHLLVFGLFLGSTQLYAQEQQTSRTKFVFGLSAPELLHTGISVDLSSYNQLGIAAGIGPSWGTVWPSLSAEHRLYVGKKNELTNRRTWFFRQGATYFPKGDNQRTLTLSVGKDLKSKASHKGWTIDAGFFILYQDARDRGNQLGPALRFQRYFYFLKGKN